jgi:hypothetical protein
MFRLRSVSHLVLSVEQTISKLLNVKFYIENSTDEEKNGFTAADPKTARLCVREAAAKP